MLSTRWGSEVMADSISAASEALTFRRRSARVSPACGWVMERGGGCAPAVRAEGYAAQCFDGCQGASELPSTAALHGMPCLWSGPLTAPWPGTHSPVLPPCLPGALLVSTVALPLSATSWPFRATR